MGKFIASIPPHGRSIASFGDMAAPMPHVRAMTAACHSSATRPRHYSIFAHGRITSFARWPQHLRDDRSIPQKCRNAAAMSRDMAAAGEFALARQSRSSGKQHWRPGLSSAPFLRISNSNMHGNAQFYVGTVALWSSSLNSALMELTLCCDSRGASWALTPIEILPVDVGIGRDLATPNSKRQS